MFIPDTGSEFFPSRIPDPGPRVRKISGSRIRIHIASKNLIILFQKNVTKLSEIKSGMFIPDPDHDFLTIPDPGSRG
jgi:hypothetical protein